MSGRPPNKNATRNNKNRNKKGTRNNKKTNGTPGMKMGPLARLMARSGYLQNARILANLTPESRLSSGVAYATSGLTYGPYQRSLLTAAAHTGNLKRLTHLVAHGANPDARNKFGRSALDEAIAAGQNAAAAHLRALGALENPGFQGVEAGVWPPSMLPGGRADTVLSLAVLSTSVVAVGNYSGSLILRGIATGAVIKELIGHTGGIRALLVLPGQEPRRLVSAGEDTSVRVWDTGTGACTATLLGHAAKVTSLALLNDGRLASGSFDRTVRLWDLTTGASIATVWPNTEVLSLAARPDGGIAVGGTDGAITLWDVAGSNIHTMGRRNQTAINVLLYLQDGGLAAGYENGLIKIWKEGDRDPDLSIKAFRSDVLSLAETLDGRLLSGGVGDTIKVWDITTPVEPYGAHITVMELRGEGIARALVESYGLVIAGYMNGFIRFWT